MDRPGAGSEPIAASIASLSWITGVLTGSRGSTVLRLTISGTAGAAGRSPGEVEGMEMCTSEVTIKLAGG